MSLADLTKGGVGGSAIAPGDGANSLLVQRITGERPPSMPFGGPPLSPREIATIRNWIDQGANADTASGEPSWIPPMALREPEIPGEGHPVDAFLKAYWGEHEIKAPQPISDSIFARRVWLDLHGVPPTPEQRAEFLRSSSANKRAELVDALLAERKLYAEHWISFWNDLLHNDEGVIYHGGRESITDWLLTALEDNLPYNRFAAELLNPADDGDPKGFVLGVNWRGDINASQTPAMQAAQNSAQVFLGVNIKCASCHDSFINDWKLSDAYGLASFFSDTELEIVRCDAKTGRQAVTRFLYPELGAVPADASLEVRKAAAAELFTKPENGRFARTFVNRMWKRLIGRGFVEPADDMDVEPWHPDLLDWLAADFANHGYNVNHLIRRIMTSIAYQAPSDRVEDENAIPYRFRGPAVRRLTAEQFTDSVSTITGQWRTTMPAKAVPARFVRDWRLKASPLARAMGRPVRDLAVTVRADDPSTLQALELVNGETLGTLLKRGGEHLTGQLPPSPEPLFDSGVVSDRVSGIDLDITGRKELRLLTLDHDTYNPARVTAGWAEAVFEGPSGSMPLSELISNPKIGALKMRGEQESQAILIALDQQIVLNIEGRGFTRFRAKAGVDESSLESDIMPKVRFLVYCEEPDLWQPLRVEGPPPMPVPGPFDTPEGLVRSLYEYAFTRPPTREETEISLPIVTAPDGRVSATGVEDLLWMLVLSPEFQFVL